MDTPLVMAHASGRGPLSALSKWTVATLAAIILMLIWLQVVVVRGFFPPLALILGLPALVVAAPIVATRWRWAPMLGAIYWILLLAVHIPIIPHDLAHPEFFNTFAFTVVVLALAVVGIVAGAGATVQNYRAPAVAEMADDRLRVPRWFPAVPWSLVGLCLGAILVGAIAPASASTGVSAETLATLPALTAAQTRFDQTDLRARAGETVALRLENHDNFGHSFNIDEFKLRVSMPPGQPSLALFKASTPGTYTFYCDVPGHREAGMVGTLTVEP